MVWASVAHADDEAPPIEIHGFISQGVLKSSDNNFLADSARGTFEYFEAGLNATKQISDRLRAGIQLFAHDLGATGDYKPKVDWAYLDYRYADWLGLRAGHIKIPFGLYNDVADIDAARPTALLPQSVYPEVNRNYLLAQSGFELYGYHRFGELGALDYRAYAGTISLGDLLVNQAPGPLFITGASIPYVVGGRLIYETPLSGLRVAGSVQHLLLEERALVTADPTLMTTLYLREPVTLAQASIEYAHDDLLFTAEYARWSTPGVTSDNQAIYPNTPGVHEHRAYALAAYRFAPVFQAAAYYALFYPPGSHDGPAGRQHDADLTLRFDITPNWIVKLEGHVMRGTAELDPALNKTNPLADHWLLFVGKTTVYF